MARAQIRELVILSGSTSARTSRRLWLHRPIRSDSRTARASSVSHTRIWTARFRSAAHSGRMTRPRLFHTGTAPVSSRLSRRVVPTSSTTTPRSLCLPTAPTAACVSSTRRWPLLTALNTLFCHQQLGMKCIKSSKKQHFMFRFHLVSYVFGELCLLGQNSQKWVKPSLLEAIHMARRGKSHRVAPLKGRDGGLEGGWIVLSKT
jgi:hypothetical protein